MSKKYIKINLNQVISRFQKEEMQVELNRWYLAGGAILCFICLFSFTYYINYQANELNELMKINTKEIKNKQNDLKRKELEGTEPGKSRNLVTTLSKKDIEGLFKFESARNYWTPKIQALADITPVEMVIEQLEFDNGKLLITAMTAIQEGVKEFDIVENFIEQIQGNDNFNTSFQNIKFVNSYKQMIQGQEIFTFKIEAKSSKSKKKKKKKKK